MKHPNSYNVAKLLFKGLVLVISGLLMVECGMNVDDENSDAENNAHESQHRLNQAKCELRRSVFQKGFHRDLGTHVVISSAHLRDVESTDCELLLQEHLPAGMYVDLYQLKSREEFGGPTVLSQVDINIEQPEYLSKSHDIYVFTRDLNLTTGALHVSVDMPVHLRYHRPSSTETYREVHLDPPKVLFKCIDETILAGETEYMAAPCDATNTSSCDWAVMQCTNDSPQLTMKVPVGHQEDSLIVSVVTVLTTLVGAIILISAAVSQ